MLPRITSGAPCRTRKTKGEFWLFKPIFGVALAAICFELLPIDFQHFLAPSLVSYDEVFYAGLSPTEYAYTVQGRQLNETAETDSVDIEHELSLN